MSPVKLAEDVGEEYDYIIWYVKIFRSDLVKPSEPPCMHDLCCVT